MLRVQVSLLGSLQQHTPPDGVLQLPTQSNVRQLLNTLGIAHEHVQTIMINHKLCTDWQSVLPHQAQVAVLPKSSVLGHACPTERV